MRTVREKLLDWPDFPPKSAPSTGKLCFFSVFGPGSEFLSAPTAVLGENGPKYPKTTVCGHRGSDRKKIGPEKVAENHPG